MFEKLAKACSLVLLALFLTAAAPPIGGPSDDGVVKVRSAYAIGETIDRLKRSVSDKGITLFTAIDQSKLGADAGLELRPSTLLVFGNPALGVQFITSSPIAGLDWPVRLLVFQDDNGVVWAAYSDFGWIARRHRIENREAAFSKASEVIASITASVQAR
jgi:uncharacterized protein (DUF302 family)